MPAATIPLFFAPRPGIRRSSFARGDGMILDMGQTLQNVGIYTASGVAAASAVVAQATRPVDQDVSGGAFLLGVASICAAAGPQVMTALKLWFEDRKDQRDKALVEIANKLSRANLRLVELEKIAAGTEEIADKARETEIRYHETQARLASQEELIDHLVAAVGDNQDDIAKVARAWKRPEPPPLAAVTNPAPIPPPPSSSRSGDAIPIPKQLLDATPPHGTPVIKP